MINVSIWNYGGAWGSVTGFNAGHAAVRILTPTRPTQVRSGDEAFYISWWPGGIQNPTWSILPERIRENKPLMGRAHSKESDLQKEGDKMRNSLEWNAFVERVKGEAKHGTLFDSIERGTAEKRIAAALPHEQGRLLGASGLGPEDEVATKLRDHKVLCTEVAASFTEADEFTEYIRQLAFFKRIIDDGLASPDMEEWYASLPRPTIMKPGTVLRHPLTNKVISNNKWGSLRPPDVSVHLPTIGDGYAAGLNDGAMIEWWRAFLRPGEDWDARRFRFMTENCSTIASAALDAGCGAIIADKPSLLLGKLWTPNSVLQYAQGLLVAIAARSVKYNDFIDRLRVLTRDGTITRLTAKHGEGREVWDERTFKKESDAGAMSHRYAALKAIDASLVEYAKIVKIVKVQTTRSLGDRIAHLAKIVAAVEGVFEDRPTSARREALAWLGRQCLHEIDRLMPVYRHQLKLTAHACSESLDPDRKVRRVDKFSKVLDKSSYSIQKR